MKKKICILLVFCLLVPLSIIEYKHLHYQNGLAILGYHNIVSDEQKANEYKNDIYSMSLSKFEKQMACLYEQGYHTLTLDEGIVGVHPNDNTATAWLKTIDLISIIKEHGNIVNIVEI